MASRRTRLVNQTEAPRKGDRDALALDGRCRVGDGEPREVRVTDLDAHGCQIRGLSIGVTKSDPLELWLGAASPVAARLRWAKNGALGIAFDEPLDEAVLGQVREAEARSTVVPLRRKAV